MAKVAGLILIAALCSLVSNNSQVAAQGAMVTRISEKCRGAKPTKLTPDERNKAQKTARWAATRNWKIEDVEVNKCKSKNLMEVRVTAKTLDNDRYEFGTFLFFDSHKSSRKAITLHAGLEMKIEYTPID